MMSTRPNAPLRTARFERRRRLCVRVSARSLLAALVGLTGVLLLPADAACAEPQPPSAGTASVGADKAPGAEATQSAEAAAMTMETFLDRLMLAESGGKLTARNPLSTAVGPYQFIASTWLMIVNRHFEKETKDLRVDQILALRMDPDLARRAADIYTQSNAAYLVANGQTATFQNLRLAFLIGPGAAVQVLSAAEETPVSQLLGARVLRANPFMARLTAGALRARAARDIAVAPEASAAITPEAALVTEAKASSSAQTRPKRPRIAVACNLTLPSCRRWLTLAERRTGKPQRRTQR